MKALAQNAGIGHAGECAEGLGNQKQPNLDRTNDGDFVFGGSADGVNPPLPERRFASVMEAEGALLEAVGARRRRGGELGTGVMPDPSLSTYARTRRTRWSRITPCAFD